MKMIAIALCLLSLSACSLTASPGRTSLTFPGDVKLSTGDGHGGNFCPPGQAKKGNC